MATGDLKNNLRKLIAELKQARFPQDELDVRGMAHGNPSAFLPLVHYMFLDFSCALAQYFAEKDYELYGKNDLRFMEVVYRILRDEFGFKPLLTRGQFLTVGFAERKILLLSEMLKFCQERHKQLNPKRGKPERKGKSAKVDQNHADRLNVNKRDRKSKTTSKTSKNTGVLTEQDNKKDFRSDGKEVLVGDMPFSQGQESWFENKENMEHLPRRPVSDQFAGQAEIAIRSNKAPSELIIRTLSSQEGGKFKPMTYTTAASKSNSSLTTKSVTWHDEVRSTVRALDETAEQCMLPQQQRPAPINLLTNQPETQFTGTVGLVHHPEGALRSLPVPVPWTVAPLPSEDLLLTPSGKATHQQIPLSGSRGYQTSSSVDVSIVDITHSIDVPHAQITRHTPSVASTSEGFDHDSPLQSILASSEEVSLLKHQFQELQEKFDSVVLQNSEMSARIIVLESKVKMLEESASANVYSNFRKPDESTHAPSSATEVRVVSGFERQRSAASRDERGVVDSDSLGTNSHSVSRRLYLERNNHSTENTSLQDDFATTDQDSVESSEKQKPNKIVVDLPTVSEKPEGSENHNPFSVYSSTPPRGGEDSMQESHTVLSPLETPDYSLAYVGSATKATVANVHKRLKETREMLMKTNREFAARFDHSQPE